MPSRWCRKQRKNTRAKKKQHDPGGNCSLGSGCFFLQEKAFAPYGLTIRILLMDFLQRSGSVRNPSCAMLVSRAFLAMMSETGRHMTLKPANPITEALRKQIEVRAYEIWSVTAVRTGRHVEHWALAEKEILGASKPKARPPKKTKADAQAQDGTQAKRQDPRKNKPQKVLGHDRRALASGFFRDPRNLPGNGASSRNSSWTSWSWRDGSGSYRSR